MWLFLLCGWIREEEDVFFVPVQNSACGGSKFEPNVDWIGSAGSKRHTYTHTLRRELYKQDLPSTLPARGEGSMKQQSKKARGKEKARGKKALKKADYIKQHLFLSLLFLLSLSPTLSFFLHLCHYHSSSSFPY